MLITLDKKKEKDKSPYWELITPNEHKVSDERYRTKLSAWGAYNGLPHTAKMFEVRIVKQQSRLVIERSARWWDQPMFMDKTFWVFQKPMSFGLGDERESYYALEYLECQRVLQHAILSNDGKNPFRDEYGDALIEPSFLVPVDCCDICWDETKAGYSEHIRYDALERKFARETPAYFEKEEALQEAVKEISKNLVDISKSEAFLTDEEKGADIEGL